MKLRLAGMAGMVLGAVARLFIKTAVVVAATAALSIGAMASLIVSQATRDELSQKVDSTLEIVEEQTEKVTHWLMAYLPRSTAAAMGFGAGFKRK